MQLLSNYKRIESYEAYINLESIVKFQTRNLRHLIYVNEKQEVSINFYFFYF